MAKLGFTVTAAQFEALGAEVKEFYVPTQDGNYELEGVGSIQRALEAEKSKNTTKAAMATELEELRKFKADQDAAKESEETDQQRKAGQFAELETKLRNKITEVETAAANEKQQILSNLKREQLTNLLVKNGVLPDRADLALGDIDGLFDLESGESGFALKLKTGIGDPKEIDAAVGSLKEKRGFLFAANGASGSGASGSQGQGGAAPDTSGTPAQRLANFYEAGGATK